MALKKISVVIPCFKVKNQILNVLEKTLKQNISKIYVIDDKCPEFSGEVVEKFIKEKNIENITVIKNEKNLGVGGATKKGFVEALKDDNDIIVKIDGDDQMDPKNISILTKCLVNEDYDYSKGNRFFNLSDLKGMPRIRIFGNAVLSFFCKLSTGYWNIFDPTNGFIAINSKIIRLLPLNKISDSYFFEIDLLFRLSTIRARIFDVPMKSIYKDEKSNLKIRKIIFEFILKLLANFAKRIFYNYYLRNITVASFELPLSLFMLLYGGIYGYSNFRFYGNLGEQTPLGIIMLTALLIILGTQFLLSFLNYDTNSYPKEPLNKNL